MPKKSEKKGDRAAAVRAAPTEDARVPAARAGRTLAASDSCTTFEYL